MDVMWLKISKLLIAPILLFTYLNIYIFPELLFGDVSINLFLIVYILYILLFLNIYYYSRFDHPNRDSLRNTVLVNLIFLSLGVLFTIMSYFEFSFLFNMIYGLFAISYLIAVFIPTSISEVNKWDEKLKIVLHYSILLPVGLIWLILPFWFIFEFNFKTAQFIYFASLIFNNFIILTMFSKWFEAYKIDIDHFTSGDVLFEKIGK